MHLKISSFIFLMLISACLAACGNFSEKYKLSDVSILTLYANSSSIRRNSVSVPQTRCIGGTGGCHAVHPSSFTCFNRGFKLDRVSIKWDCKTENIGWDYRVSYTNVTCEGYENIADPYVLIGSCSVDYRIDYSYANIMITAAIVICALIAFLSFWIIWMIVRNWRRRQWREVDMEMRELRRQNLAELIQNRNRVNAQRISPQHEQPTSDSTNNNDPNKGILVVPLSTTTATPAVAEGFLNHNHSDAATQTSRSERNSRSSASSQ